MYYVSVIFVFNVMDMKKVASSGVSTSMPHVPMQVGNISPDYSISSCLPICSLLVITFCV